MIKPFDRRSNDRPLLMSLIVLATLAAVTGQKVTSEEQVPTVPSKQLPPSSASLDGSFADLPAG